MSYLDGCYYKGTYREGRKHGQGSLTRADGQRYTGGFKDDEFHGKGVQLWMPVGSEVFKQNGEEFGIHYEGEWCKQQRHGEGTITFPDGIWRRSRWDRNKEVETLERGKHTHRAECAYRWDENGSAIGFGP